MAFSNNHASLFLLIFLVLLTPPSSARVLADGDQVNCQSITWEKAKDKVQPTSISGRPRPSFTPSVPEKRFVEPGDINCRNWGRTYDKVDYAACVKVAQGYGITMEKFFMLNPILEGSCKDLKPYTKYCVAGCKFNRIICSGTESPRELTRATVIEPKRAFDGRCGPKYGNATCIGTDYGGCCNSETWNCGDSEYEPPFQTRDLADPSSEDRSPGICYEGLCAGHDVYTTDGTCGHFNNGRNLRACAPKWGACCSFEGRCGDGPSYCGLGNCSFGACEARQAPKMPEVPNLWTKDWTTDGTCGGEKGLVCGVFSGPCCNKHGRCGYEEEDCGEGW